MLLSATITFDQVVLFIHIVAVVIAFGLVIVYPFISLAAERIDHRALPALHRTRQQLGRLIINPGLALVLISGIYLASEDHYWKFFFTQWGLAMVVILGGLEGAIVMRGEGRLAELSEAEVAATGQTGQLSTEYVRARTRNDMVSRIMAILVILTIFFMAVQLN